MVVDLSEQQIYWFFFIYENFFYSDANSINKRDNGDKKDK